MVLVLMPVRVGGGLLAGLAVYLVGDSQLLAAFCATCGQHAPTVSRGHAFAETMFVLSLPVVRLVSPFHMMSMFICL